MPLFRPGKTPSGPKSPAGANGNGGKPAALAPKLPATTLGSNAYIVYTVAPGVSSSVVAPLVSTIPQMNATGGVGVGGGVVQQQQQAPPTSSLSFGSQMSPQMAHSPPQVRSPGMPCAANQEYTVIPTCAAPGVPGVTSVVPGPTNPLSQQVVYSQQHL